MLQAIRKEIHTQRAGHDPLWNWRGFRTPEGGVVATDDQLPPQIRPTLISLKAYTGGNPVLIGAGLIPGRPAKDYDGYVLADSDPREQMAATAEWAARYGHSILPNRRRVRLLWKRLKIETRAGILDLGFVKGTMPIDKFTQLLAGEADVGICARSAALESSYKSWRCIEGEAKRQLIFRALETPRDQYRHMSRWHKNAIVKFSDHQVVYECPENAALFTQLNARRRLIAARHKTLVEQGNTPTDIKPFRPIIGDLYDRLYAAKEHEKRLQY